MSKTPEPAVPAVPFESPLVPDSGPVTVMQILQMAVQQGTPVEALEKLVALQERVTDRNAAAAFNRALADFQAECPLIEKRSIAKITPRGGGEGYAYRYAELDTIARTIRPLLVRHGLAYSWNSKIEGANLACACILRHVEGHSQSATFSCPTTSASPGMSDPQKHASALTFAKRQSLVQVLGLTMTEPDTDAANDRTITEAQARKIEDEIAELGGSRSVFLEKLNVPDVRDILQRDLARVNAMLAAKRRQVEGGGR